MLFKASAAFVMAGTKYQPPRGLFDEKMVCLVADNGHEEGWGVQANLFFKRWGDVIKKTRICQN